MRLLSVLSVLLMLLVANIQRARAEGVAENAKVDFAREVRPILSDKCFQCHGPDDAHREGGMRLDTLDAVQRPTDSGALPVVAGDPDASELLQRIASDDEDLRMPPASTGKSLSADEIDAIRRWIAESAEWQMHWAFRTPVRPEPPPARQSDWPANAVDHFVLAELERHGLELSHLRRRTAQR